MGRYIDWDDVVARHPQVADLGGADEVSSIYIAYAEGQVEAKLAGFFAVPFSSNNLTAKDLCISMTFAKTLEFKDEKKFKSVNDRLESVIGELRDGTQAMVTDSGDPMYSNGTGAAWSSTEDYHGSFGMLDTEDQLIDPDWIEDEWNDRT